MNLRDAAKQIVDYAPHVSRAQNPIPVPARMLADLAEALEAEKRVQTVPYDREAALAQLREYRERHPVVPDSQIPSTLHTAMFGE